MQDVRQYPVQSCTRRLSSGLCHTCANVPYMDPFLLLWGPTRASMGLFSNMARYVGAVAAWSVAMPQVVRYLENDRIAR